MREAVEEADCLRSRGFDFQGSFGPTESVH